MLAAQHAAATAELESGASVAFSSEDPTTFVVGLEAGHLYKGSLLANELRSARAITREPAEGFRSIRRPDGGWIFVDRMRDEGAIARATRFARRGTTGLARWGAP